MKALSSTTIFLCSSSRRLFIRTSQQPLFDPEGQLLVGISHFSTSASDSSVSASYHSSSRRSPEDVRNVRVSVWWDFENCSVPCNANVFKVTQSITSAVRANGIKGPIQITAFGDVLQLSRPNQEALSSTGINLAHVPHGGKNSADRSLLVDLMYWVSQNPPPAHLFLISGDRDFASILHRLRMNNYNILLASTDSAPAVLCSAASIMWQWTELVKGENLSGKHFNQPPDGPYASWYGHYRVPLEDPFAISNQTSCVQPEEVTDSKSELRPVPKAVVNVIRNILNSYPKGLSITELRSELGKSNVTIEKDLYGHKKFSRFLSAMPYLLRLQSAKDGQYFVHGINPKTRETCVPTPSTPTGVSTIGKDSVPVVASMEHGGRETSVPPREEVLSSSSKLKVPKLSKDSPALAGKQEEPQQVQEQPPLIEKANEGEVSLGQLYSTPEVGVFKSIWRKWFRGSDGYQEKSGQTVNECSTLQNGTDTVNADVKSKDQSSDLGKLSPSSSSANEVTQDAEIAQKRAENVDKFSKPHGIFNQIVRWCKFWQSDKNPDHLNAELSQSDKETSIQSEMQKILTESYWNDILAFLKTPKGSVSILQAKTREEMVQSLQRYGSCGLQSLSERHILHLVELLISEKKWVVESPSQAFPFRLVGGCSSSKKSTKRDMELTESAIDSRVGSSIKNPKSRSQILSECQKLVNEVVKEYPDGFKISSFKKLFLERYGYHLEVQQLGYQKLATLLQIMPGAKLESNCILPSRGSPISKMEDDNTQWEELGPIKNDDFESVSDNDVSDSEEETRRKGPQKHGRREEDSSLLQILDSWYGDGNGNGNGDGDGNREDNSSRIASERKKPSALSSEQKASKRYSFVAEDDKENLINGILGSLKKSESKIEG